MKSIRNYCRSGIWALAFLFIAFPLAATSQDKRDIKRADDLVAEGNRIFNQRDFVGAIDKYAEAIMLVPANSNARFWKGAAHYYLNEYDMALPELDMAISQGYSRPLDVYRIRWRLHYAKKDWAAAESDVNNGLTLDPDNLEFLIAKGDLAMVGDRYSEALIAYEKAVTRAPNNGALHMNLARLYRQMGDNEKQAEAAQQAIQKGTQDTGEAYLLLAEARKNLRQYDQAIAAYDRALNIDPKNYEIYRSLADLYRVQNLFDDAIRISRKALTVFEADGEIYTDLSWYYSLAERHADAVEAAKAAILYAPKQYMAYTNLCRAYNDLNRPEMAIRECNKALELRPNDGETNFYLGYAHTLMNRHNDAAVYYKRAVTGLEQFTRENKSYADGYYLLGNAYLSDQQTQKAIDAYREALNISPRFARARYNLGVSLASVNDKDGAMEQYRLLLDLDASRAEKLKAEIDKR